MKNQFCKLLLLIISIFFGNARSFAIEVSVKDYGAKGDGITDDRLSIQASIDAVDKAGGGTVIFPEGIYSVSAPNKGEWQPQVKLCNNLKFQGLGMYKSVVKVADNQRAYDVIFSGPALSGFTMLDMGIDANGATNPLISEADAVKSPYLHTIVYLPQSKDISIQRCRFTNLSGVWAVYGLGRAENFLIDACVFDNIGGYTKNDWDHSCIRIDGYGPINVTNTIFSSRLGSGSSGCRTAVELHGSNILFANNRISGFRYGINVCSGGDNKLNEPSVHQYYKNNFFTNVGSGFCIWGIENRKFDDLVFENNTIIIDCTGWGKIWPDFSGIEIISYSDMTPPLSLENVRITDNHITYINTDGGTPRSFGMKFDMGVLDPRTKSWSVNPEGKMKNVKITRNIINGAYWTGMYFNCVAENIEIADNILIDPAMGVKDKDKEWQSAIKLANSMEGMKITDNKFYIHKSSGFKNIIYDGAKNKGKCEISGNSISNFGPSVVNEYFKAPSQSGERWKVTAK